MTKAQAWVAAWPGKNSKAGRGCSSSRGGYLVASCEERGCEDADEVSEVRLEMEAVL